MKEYLIRLEDDISPTDISHIDEDGAVWICHHYGKLGETTADSTIVELPPHGRLGDLDKMYTETLESFSVWPEHCANDFACFIKDAPTVIGASK